jgi:hypothetical protein
MLILTKMDQVVRSERWARRQESQAQAFEDVD